MEEPFIGFETAKLLNSIVHDILGEEAHGYYDKDGKLRTSAEDSYGNDNIPTYRQAYVQQWLRDIYGWHIILIPVVTMGYTYKITKVWKKDFDPEEEIKVEQPPYKEVNAYDYNTYEEALEAGLLEALKLI